MRALTIVISLLVFFVVNHVLADGTLVRMTVRLSPAGSYVAKTSDVQGTVKVNGDKVIASNVKIQTKSLKTGIALRDKHTHERLHADQFPEIILVSGEGTSGKGEGIVKINGVERPFEGTYTLAGKTLNAQFNLSIKEFGIENVKYLGVGVKDMVEIVVQVPISSN